MVLLLTCYKKAVQTLLSFLVGLTFLWTFSSWVFSSTIIHVTFPEHLLDIWYRLVLDMGGVMNLMYQQRKPWETFRFLAVMAWRILGELDYECTPSPRKFTSMFCVFRSCWWSLARPMALSTCALTRLRASLRGNSWCLPRGRSHRGEW